MSNRQRYLWRGFLWGFGILAVPTLVFLGLAIIINGREFWRAQCWGAPWQYGLLFLASGLATAVVTGLIGMLIGYVVYRIRR